MELVSEEGTAYYQKSDVFNRIMWYSFDKESTTGFIPLPVGRVREIVELNRKGIKVKKLSGELQKEPPAQVEYNNVIEEESPDRFADKHTHKRKKRKKGKGNHPHHHSS